MRGKPDVSAFLEGGKADRAERGTPPPPTDTATPPKMPIPTVQKNWRLRWDTASALKDRVEALRREGETKLTETDFVERLIRKELGLDS